VSLIISLLGYDATLTGYVNLHFRGAYSLLQDGHRIKLLGELDAS
jgi:hypothetical protein